MASRVESVSAMTAFVWAAELKSFKSAGQQVGLSPSAIGKAIAKLEEQLGTRLFHRSTRSIGLTHEGRLFLERCKRVLCELDAAEEELAHATAVPRGPLRVGLPPSMHVLTPLLGAFLAEHPEIQLNLDYNDRLVDLIEEGFDAVIRTGEPNDSRLMHVKLGDFSWRLVASPDYLARRGRPETPADLVSHALLHHRFSVTGKLGDWGADLPEGLSLPTTVASTVIDPLIQLAEAGHGIASLPYFAVRGRLDCGALEEVLGSSRRRCGTLRLLWPRSRFPLPKISAFVSFMAAGVSRALAEPQTP